MFERKTRAAGLPTEVIRPKQTRSPVKSKKPTTRKEVSLVTRARKFFFAMTAGTVAAIAFAAPASAANGIRCQSNWSNAIKPVLDNITGNAVGLFVGVGSSVLVVVLVALLFLHATRHRAVLVATIAILFVIAIGIFAGPTIFGTLTSGIC